MYQIVEVAMGEQAAGQVLYLRGQTSLSLARHAGPRGGLHCKADLVVAWVKRSLESCIAYDSDTLLSRQTCCSCSFLRAPSTDVVPIAQDYERYHIIVLGKWLPIVCHNCNGL
jgi:hypothetical protein